MKANSLVKRTLQGFGDIPELNDIGMIVGIEYIKHNKYFIVLWRDGLSWEDPDNIEEIDERLL